MPSCMYCAEDVAKGATKCPHCGESLVSPRSKVGLVRWFGDTLLVTADGGHVPSRGCVMCASSEATSMERKFTYTPSWVYIGLLGGLIPLIILAVIGQKKATVWMPLCNRCLWRWRLGEAGLLLFALGGIFGLPALFGTVAQAIGRKQDAFVVGLLIGFVVWLVGVVLLKLHVSRKMQVRCVLVENGEASLAFPDVAHIRGLVDTNAV